MHFLKSPPGYAASWGKTTAAMAKRSVISHTVEQQSDLYELHRFTIAKL